MPRGASPKREEEYRQLKERFEKEGRYQGREANVASRIVNKQRRMYGETKGQQRQEQEGRSPDRGLPIYKYRHQTRSQIIPRLKHFSPGEIRRMEEYEKRHKNRKTLIRQFEKALREQQCS